MPQIDTPRRGAALIAPGDSPPLDEIFLPAAQVRSRYGVTDMTLWRWLSKKSADFQFPRPIEIFSRRYWRLSELQAFEARCVVSRAPADTVAPLQKEAIGREVAR